MFYSKLYRYEIDLMNINFLMLIVDYVVNKLKKKIYVKYNLVFSSELIVL